jgi:hypothetical protein
VAGFSGAIAASAVFFIVTLDRFVPGIANGDALLAIPIPLTPIAFTFSIHTLTASALIVVFAIIHILGVGPGRAASNALTTLKILAFVLFIVFGLSAGTGSPANLTASGGTVTLTGWMFAMIPVMFTYSGWNAASYMAEEIRDPGRNVPRALILGTVGVVIIYLFINVLYLYVIPIAELGATQGSVLDVVADRLLGQRAGNIMAGVALVSLAAGINAWTFAGPRVYFAMARDGLFFKSAARVHPKYKTPAASIVAQAVFSILLVLTGSLDSIANYVGFADHVVCRNRGGRHLRPACPRAAGAASLSGLGLSRDAGDLRVRQRRDRAQRALHRPRGDRHRCGHHPGRRSALLVLPQQAEGGGRVGGEGRGERDGGETRRAAAAIPCGPPPSSYPAPQPRSPLGGEARYGSG